MPKNISRSNRVERMPTLRRGSLFSPLFEDVFEPLFGDFMPFSGENQQPPAIDIDETENEYIVTADLPGVKKENIRIETSGNQLTISAERKSDTETGKRSERRERFYGSYVRSFTLPPGTEMEKIEATSDGGVLTIRVPKGETSKSRRIEIKESQQANKKEEETEKKSTQH